MAFWYNKIDSYRWINGSIRQDLFPDERSVWADFLALAGLTREPRRGWIERSEGIGYPKNVLLSMLNITEDLFDRTVEKCVKEGRLLIEKDKDGNVVMCINNWLNYNDVTDYKKKKEAKEIAMAKANQTKREKDTIQVALLRAVNTLNLNLKTERYEIRGDDVIDIKTGEIVDINKIKKEDKK